MGNPLLASPDAGTPDGGAIADASAMTQIIPATNNGQFLDGPQWIDANGATGGFLVFSEYLQTPRLRKVYPDGGGAAPFRAPGFIARAGAQKPPDIGPLGNAVRNGFVLTAAAATPGTTSSIFQTLITDGGAGPVIPIGAGVSSPNDLVVGKGGQIYFTAPGYQTNNGQGIYQTLGDAGGPSLIVAFGANDEPNGIAISPDGTKLYVSFTALPRIDSYPIVATGVVGTVATPVITAANITDPPDGIAVDVGGNIYVAEANATPGTKTGAVEVFNAAGKKLGKIPFTNDRPTGVAFGGGDKKALFITGENGVYTFSGRCAGLP